MAERGNGRTVPAERRRVETGPPRSLHGALGGGWLPLVAGLVWSRLAFTFEKEMEAGRGFLWLPVVFGGGILGYYALPREPWAPALLVTTAALAIAAWRARFRIVAFRVLVAASAVVAGFAAGKVRTDLVEAPRLPRAMTARVTGWIAGLEEAGKGVRIYLRVHDIEGVASDHTPRTVRITVRSHADQLVAGEAISVLARLSPPGGPVMPGGYDFARAAFYDRIGAYGFAYGAAKPAAIGAAPLAVRLGLPLARQRTTIRARIEAALPGDDGHLAAALVVGDQGGISEKTQNAMRASGLGHILAISGLHMALVAGASFWLIRALLALSANLTLVRPIKKWAAAGALAVAAGYLGISGAGVATQRAFIMLAIMLAAVMIDRRAVTLRNVALAALVVLVMAPETLLTASFQMSFAATAALISAYEAISAWLDRRDVLTNPRQGVGARLRWYAATLFVTSLTAGLATAPFAAFHFHRVAPLTLLANLAAMPAVGLVVMPMALAAVILMPFGLEILPLAVMRWGLDWVVFVATTIAAWSAGHGGVAAVSAVALLLAVAGFLWLVLWRERWRLAGLVPMALVLPIAVAASRPDVVVAETGTVAAVRGDDGRYVILGGRGAAFEIAYWLTADADPRPPDAPDLTDGVACDPLGCIGTLGGGGEVALVTRADAFWEDCRTAQIVISRLDAPAGCRTHALVIDGAVLGRGGAEALYRQGAGFRVEAAYPSLRRPFMPPAAE